MQTSDFEPLPGVRVESAGFVSFLEGPAEGPDGAIYFSDIMSDRLLRLLAGEISVVRWPSGRSNGNVLDLDGRLVTCEGSEYGPGGGRRIVRTELGSGTLEVVTDRYQGGRYNSPNDICVDSHGRIYFTDPCYNSHTALEQDAEAVYRIDPDGVVERIVAQPSIERPNGVAVSPDDTELYLVDSNHGVGGHRKLWAFRLAEDGRVHDQRLVWDFAPGRGGDGVEVAADGTLYCCAGIRTPRKAGETALYPAGVYLISPAGDPLGVIPVPEDVISNCCFAGPDRTRLYITSGRTIYAVDGVGPGYHAAPPVGRDEA
jgi:gluconolactonase